MTRNIRARWAVAGLGLALVVSGVLVAGPSVRPRPDSRSAVSSAASPAETPVAFYDAGDHRMFPGLDSPDRTPFVSSARPAGFTAPPPGAGIRRYLDQVLRWQPCGDFACTSVTVPLDWDNPDGEAITLALKRARATGTRLGTLFINPGGPGASGIDFLSWFPTAQFPGYDVIGWDPRGSGVSTPVRCGTPAETDAYFAVDASPDTPAEWQALRGAQMGFAQQCRTASGALLDHISTIDTARDLDYLRYLAGDARLNYLGVSYGTYLGAVYAELYPRRVGRMVLDSAVNITDDPSLIQAIGFDLALRSFGAWCATSSCGLGPSPDRVVATVTGLFDRLEARPARVGARTLTQTLAVGGVASFLYSGVAGYEGLSRAVTAAVDGSGAELLAAADRLNGRRVDGSYDPVTYAFAGIGCRDAGDDGWVHDAADWAGDERLAPIFGKYFGPPVTCDLWSARPDDQLHITASGAPPIVVLGVTGDPATPYQQAVTMARQLTSGVLVTWQGAGHSAFVLGNPCIRRVVLDYVNDGVVPRDGSTC